MAFGGTAVVKKIDTHWARITGITLAGSGDSSGVISLVNGPGDVQLPAGFPSASPISDMSYLDLIRVTVNTIGDGAAQGLRVDMQKQGDPLRITLSAYEATGGELPSTVELEVYVECLRI